MSALGQAAPRQAPADQRPCGLVRLHIPWPVRTQGHHRRPQYLQRRLWGEVRDETLLWVCGTCHDSIHTWLNALLGEGPTPRRGKGSAAHREALAAFGWYSGERARG